jgi:hypothetical protein
MSGVKRGKTGTSMVAKRRYGKRRPQRLTSPIVSDVTITRADGTVEVEPAMRVRDADALVRRTRRRTAG